MSSRARGLDPGLPCSIPASVRANPGCRRRRPRYCRRRRARRGPCRDRSRCRRRPRGCFSHVSSPARARADAMWLVSRRASSRRTALNSGEDTSRGRGRSMVMSFSIRPGPALMTRTRSASSDRLLNRMGDEDDGHAGARPDLQQLALQLLAGERVERTKRLVHQQDVGVVGKHARDRHALLHAARELARIAVGEALEADQLDELVGDRRRSPCAATGAGAARSRCSAEPSSRETARSPEIPCRGRCPGPVIGLPSTKTSPVVGSSKPATMRNSVDLPQPEAPIRQTNSPSRDVTSMRASASISSSPTGKRLVTPRMTTCGRSGSGMMLRAPAQHAVARSRR